MVLTVDDGDGSDGDMRGVGRSGNKLNLWPIYNGFQDRYFHCGNNRTMLFKLLQHF